MRLAFLGLGLSVAACSQGDSRCLVVLTFSVDASVKEGAVQKLSVDIPIPDVDADPFMARDKSDADASLQFPVTFGFFVDGLVGTVHITASALDGRGCTIAQGDTDVTLARGQVVSENVKLSAVVTNVCPPGVDAGAGDARDAGVPDTHDQGDARDGSDDGAIEAGGDLSAETSPTEGGQDGRDGGSPDTAGSDGGGGGETGEADAEGGVDDHSCAAYCAALTPLCPTNAETIGGVQACLALCDTFFPASGGEASSGQIACRQNQLKSPAVEVACSAGAFSGGGICGLTNPPTNWCDVYCEFSATVCNRFGMSTIQCVQNCSPLPIFPVDSTTGDNVSCRIRQLIITAGLDPSDRAASCDTAAIMPTSGPCR